MQGKHYVTVGMLLTSLALMVASLDHWGDAIKPQFVAGLMTAVGTVLKAMYEDKPTNGGGSVSNGTRAAIGVAVLLAGALAFSGCALTGSSRHKAVVGSTALYTAIAGIDDVEMGLFTAGQISPAQHATLNPRIVTLLKAGKAANAAVAAWPHGSPAPAELLAAVQELGASRRTSRRCCRTVRRSRSCRRPSSSRSRQSPSSSLSHPLEVPLNKKTILLFAQIGEVLLPIGAATTVAAVRRAVQSTPDIEAGDDAQLAELDRHYDDRIARREFKPATASDLGAPFGSTGE
jgi:hypothetical protein